MYLYKPEDGFSVSVLYVNKEMLNINLLQNAREIHENEEDDTDKDNLELNLTRHAEIEEENEYDESEEKDEVVNSRLVFDDEDYSNDEVLKMVHKRNMSENSMCTLIFDAENTDIDWNNTNYKD